MQKYLPITKPLKKNPKTWLITGAAFIGSNFLETLLTLNRSVVGMYNFVAGNEANLIEAQSLVAKK
jgi:hypothetical protein